MYTDRLAAVGAEADKEISDLTVANESLTDQHTADQARIKQLEDELAASKPPPTTENPYRKYLGINGHSTFNNDPVYGDDAKVLATFKDLGATWARDILSTKQDQCAYFKACKDMGMKLCLTLGTYDTWNDSAKAATLAKLKQYASIISAVAGFNEPDNGRSRSMWLPKVKAQQTWIWNTIKSDPQFSHIKVLPGAIMNVNPNLAEDLKALYAAIDGLYDFPNAHIYPADTPNVESYIANRFAMFPAAPWVTEGGASTLRQTKEIQSRNCKALLKACADAGTPMFVYEAVDNAAEGANTTDPEIYFGVYDNRYQRKPAATELRKMVGLE